MIAEPYICKEAVISANHGEIKWFHEADECLLEKIFWQPYADFEREKLKELHADGIGVSCIGSYELSIRVATGKTVTYNSCDLIDYHEVFEDSESSRLLKRAEFLRAVCEKEGVEWPPKGEKCKFPERDYYTKGEIDAKFNREFRKEVVDLWTNYERLKIDIYRPSA